VSPISELDTSGTSIAASGSVRSLHAVAVLVSMLLPVRASAAPFAYVTSTDGNAVVVIDTATDTVGRVIPVGTLPYGSAVTPDGSRVYVTNEGSSSVSVIGTWVDEVVATIPVGQYPFGVAVHPDGNRVYVVNRGDTNFGGSISVIDVATNAVVGTIALGLEPRMVAFDPTGARAYATNRKSGTVSVIDTASSTVVATIPVGTTPYGIDVDASGARVYNANTGDGSVSVIDTRTLQVIATIPVGSEPRGVAVHPDGGSVWVANRGSGDVAVIDTAALQVVATTIVGPLPIGIAFTPDGARVYVTISGAKTKDGASSGAVYALDGATAEVIDEMTAGITPSTYGKFIGPAVPAVPTATRTPSVGGTSTATMVPTPSPTPTNDDPNATTTPSSTATATPPPEPTVTAQSTSTGPTLTPSTSSTPTIFGCSGQPLVGCRRPTKNLRTWVVIRKRVPATKNTLAWAWVRGEATELDAFGEPVARDAYAVCMYDESIGFAPLRFAAVTPVGDACDGKPCWKALRRGFRFADRHHLANGLQSIVLTAGADGAARVLVTAVGSLNPALPLGLPVRAQLQNARSECWEASFDAPSVKSDDATRFEARARVP